MDNKIKKYLDRIVIILVRETKIDYDREEIYFPTAPHRPSIVWILPSSFTYSYSSDSFFDYCENMFGLTKEEIEYVFKQYKDIIKDKLENELPGYTSFR